jgi:23S rRNA pseudouridine2605 synthase
LPPPKHKRSTDEIFSEPQRLHKVLAACGFGSRRAMEEMILAGRITVNRMPAEVGQKVGPGDEVRINGELVKVRFAEPRPRVLVYHKPAGEIVTRDDPAGRTTVFEKLPSIGNGKWINVGRLDYNTEGLLLFTNSGELANRLMHPRYEVEREYAVRVMGRLTDEQQKALVAGVQLDDGIARCDSVDDAGGDDDASNHWYRVVLREGRNREVRRLFEALGVMVSRLIRTRYGTVAMPPAVKRGEFVELDSTAVAALLESAGMRAPSAPVPPRGRSARPGQRQRGGKPPHRHQGAPAPSHSHAQPVAHGGAAARPHRKAGRPGQPAKAKAKPRQGRPHGPGGAGGPARGPHQQQHRSRDRRNFDEIQPQSNANASPLATARAAGATGAAPAFDATRDPVARGERRTVAGAHAGHAKSPAISFRPPSRRRVQLQPTEVDGNAAAKPGTPVPVDDET